MRVYEADNGFRSDEARSAISEWAEASLADLGAARDQLEAGYGAFCQARDIMRQARPVRPERVPKTAHGRRAGEADHDGRGYDGGAFTIPVVSVLAMVASNVY